MFHDTGKAQLNHTCLKANGTIRISKKGNHGLPLYTNYLSQTHLQLYKFV